MRSKKYMAIKKSHWIVNHKKWDRDSRQGMKSTTAYEVVKCTLDDSSPFRSEVVLFNNLKAAKAYFKAADVYEVTPEENPEMFL